MNEYTLILKSAQGIVLTRSLPFTRLEWVRAERQVGWLSLNIPGGLLPDTSILQQDGRLEIWRSVNGGAAYLEGGCQWLIRFFQKTGDIRNIYIEAADPNFVLDSAMIDYPASTDALTNANSTKTDYADDMIKAFVYENIGAGATDTTRINPFIAVSVDNGLAPSFTKDASRRNLLATCQEIANYSIGAGTYLTWDWIINGDNWTLETYINQLGLERGITISPESGNLLNPTWTYDTRREITVAKVGGKGDGAARAIGSSISARATITPFSRREAFKSGYNTDDTTELDAEALTMLQEAAPVTTFTGDFVSTDGIAYGVNLFYGDLIYANAAGLTAQCRIDNIHGLIENGKETIEIKLRGEAE